VAREYRHVIVLLPPVGRAHALTEYYNHVYKHGGWSVVSVSFLDDARASMADVVLVTDEVTVEPPPNCLGLGSFTVLV